MENIDKNIVVASLVRCFFSAFHAGVADCLRHGDGHSHTAPTSKEMKQAMLALYEQVADMFHDVLFYPIASICYTYDEIRSVLNSLKSQRVTMADLIRTACRDEATFDLMVDEYKANFGALLDGKDITPAAFLARLDAISHCGTPIATDTAIQTTVRLAMQAYAKGLKAGGKGYAAWNEPTKLRLVMEAMAALLHTAESNPLENLPADDTVKAFTMLCRTEHNLMVMAAEMEHETMVMAEEIRSEKNVN